MMAKKKEKCQKKKEKAKKRFLRFINFLKLHASTILYETIQKYCENDTLFFSFFVNIANMFHIDVCMSGWMMERMCKICKFFVEIFGMLVKDLLI